MEDSPPFAGTPTWQPLAGDLHARPWTLPLPIPTPTPKAHSSCPRRLVVETVARSGVCREVARPAPMATQHGRHPVHDPGTRNHQVVVAVVLLASPSHGAACQPRRNIPLSRSPPWGSGRTRSICPGICAVALSQNAPDWRSRRSLLVRRCGLGGWAGGDPGRSTRPPPSRWRAL